MYNNDNIRNYVVFLFGKRYILRRYQNIVIRGTYYIFLGIFDENDPIPNVTCIYVVGDEVRMKTVKRPMIPKEKKSKVAVPETSATSDDTPLKIDISVEDDELMIIMKSILLKRRLTVGHFKSLYGEQRKTDMNNDKSRLENKHTLSWNKFKFLLDLLGHKYELIIFDNE